MAAAGGARVRAQRYIITPRDVPSHRCDRVASGDALRAHQPDFARSPTKFSTEYRSGVGVGRIIESACIHGTRKPRLIDVLVQPLKPVPMWVWVWHAAVAYCSVALWLESTC